MNSKEMIDRHTLAQFSNEWREARKDNDQELMEECRELIEYFCKLYEIPYKGPNWDYLPNPSWRVFLNNKEIKDRDEKESRISAYKSK